MCKRRKLKGSERTIENKDNQRESRSRNNMILKNKDKDTKEETKIKTKCRMQNVLFSRRIRTLFVAIADSSYGRRKTA